MKLRLARCPGSSTKGRQSDSGGTRQLASVLCAVGPSSLSACSLRSTLMLSAVEPTRHSQANAAYRKPSGTLGPAIVGHEHLRIRAAPVLLYPTRQLDQSTGVIGYENVCD